MPRINGWKQIQHYSNLEDAKKDIDTNGQVKIGVWAHDDVDGRIEHIFDPDAEEGVFIVRFTNDDRNFKEEGRYQTRQEGNRANKTIMRNYPP